jgi:hypothetical protein
MQSGVNASAFTPLFLDAERRERGAEEVKRFAGGVQE